MPSRRRTREFVLQVLFAADACKQNPHNLFEFLESHFASDQEEVLQLHRVMKDFARDLVRTVSTDLETIDQSISKLSHNWKLHRLNRVDRNILRLAIAEIINFPNVPATVILNEAIELAKKYGTENSPAFVNGILDRIHLLQPRPTTASEMLELISKLD